MVDDVSIEYRDALLLRFSPRVICHLDVERKDDGELLRALLRHHAGLQHISSLHRTDVDAWVGKAAT